MEQKIGIDFQLWDAALWSGSRLSCRRVAVLVGWYSCFYCVFFCCFAVFTVLLCWLIGTARTTAALYHLYLPWAASARLFQKRKFFIAVIFFWSCCLCCGQEARVWYGIMKGVGALSQGASCVSRSPVALTPRGNWSAVPDVAVPTSLELHPVSRKASATARGGDGVGAGNYSSNLSSRVQEETLVWVFSRTEHLWPSHLWTRIAQELAVKSPG